MDSSSNFNYDLRYYNHKEGYGPYGIIRLKRTDPCGIQEGINVSSNYAFGRLTYTVINYTIVNSAQSDRQPGESLRMVRHPDHPQNPADKLYLKVSKLVVAIAISGSYYTNYKFLGENTEFKNSAWSKNITNPNAEQKETVDKLFYEAQALDPPYTSKRRLSATLQRVTPPLCPYFEIQLIKTIQRLAPSVLQIMQLYNREK